MHYSAEDEDTNKNGKSQFLRNLLSIKKMLKSLLICISLLSCTFLDKLYIIVNKIQENLFSSIFYKSTMYNSGC